MFHFPGSGPQPTWKHPVYLITSAVLGGMLSVLVQILLVMTNIDDQAADFSLGTPWRLALIGFGIILGWLVGRFWWRWVYVERRWGEKTPPTPTA